MVEQLISCPSCGKKIPVTRALRDEIEESVRDRLTEEHRLKDAEKERQLADMRRQIEDLKRKAEQGSQQAQGEAGEEELEKLVRSSFTSDDITAIRQGVHS